MANRNWSNGGKVYQMHTSPVSIDMKFTVDNTQVNGISNLKGPTVANVYMNSAAATPNTLNPAAGSIVIQLQDGYNQVLNVETAIESPNSGSPLTSTTAHTPCVITSLGTATAAQSLTDFQAVGLPRGITPAVGVAFVPTSSATIGHSATVEIAAAAGSAVMSLEVLGKPSTTCNPTPSANQGFGAQIILQARDKTGAIAAPAAGSTIMVKLLLSNSSVTVQGE